MKEENKSTAGIYALKRMIMTTLFMMLVVGVVSSLTGCAATMASRQPSKKNVDLFSEGTYRSELIAEFGQPLGTEVRPDGKRYEVYKFVQGYGTGAKVARTITHVALDMGTLFVWEIIGIPIETVCDGQEMAYEIAYNENNRVDHVIALKQK